jgi:hypothetical protein
MAKTHSVRSVARLQPDDLELSNLTVILGNAYVRLAARDRRKVMHLLEQLAFGKASSVSYWDLWSNDDMQACCLQMKPISPKMANDLRRWASVLLKAGNNNKLALKCLMDELTIRTWIEKP